MGNVNNEIGNRERGRDELMNNNFSKNKNKTNTELRNATNFLTVSTTDCTFAASDIHDENNRVICSLVAQWMQLWHVITNETSYSYVTCVVCYGHTFSA